MYCTKCGKELPEGSGFCVYCGTKLSEGKDRKSKLRLPMVTGKKAKVIMVSLVCCAGIAALAMTLNTFLYSPKQKVLLGIKKTATAAVSGDTTLNGILGLDDMKKEIKTGRTRQNLELSFPAAEAGMRTLICSDKKEGLYSLDFYPTWENMDLANVSIYKNNSQLYFGLPDILNDTYCLDLEGIKNALSNSAAERYIQEYTGIKISSLIPEEDKSKKEGSYTAYCQEELEQLYENIAVEKDGKSVVKINGKNQNCARYQITIPGNNLKSLLAKSMDYIADTTYLSLPAHVTSYIFAYPIWSMNYMDPNYKRAVKQENNQMLSRLKMPDLEMTVCLDKKGRLVTAQSNWHFSWDGQQTDVEFNANLTGGASPFDKAQLSFSVTNGGYSQELTLLRDKKFDKKTGIKDSCEITLTDSSFGHSSYSYSYPLTYESSYNIQSGDWNVSIFNDYNYINLQAEGEISDFKKGKSINVILYELSDLNRHHSLLEGSYELAGLGKESVTPLKGSEDAVPVLDLGTAELANIARDLTENWLNHEIVQVLIPGRSYKTAETTAAPAETTTAATEETTESY